MGAKRLPVSKSKGQLRILSIYADSRRTVTAPRSVELEEDILFVLLHNDILERIRNDGIYGIILSLGNRLALDASCDLALAVSSDKVGDRLGVDGGGLRERELELLLDLLDGEGRPCRLGKVERLGMVGKLRNDAQSQFSAPVIHLPSGTSELTLLVSIQTKLILPLYSRATGSMLLTRAGRVGSSEGTKMYASGIPASAYRAKFSGEISSRRGTACSATKLVRASLVKDLVKSFRPSSKVLYITTAGGVTPAEEMVVGSLVMPNM